jgi:hypothetical protein
MSIEKKIEDLIASIDANTAALVKFAGGGQAADAKPATPAATKPAATKPAATKPAATKPAAKTEEQLSDEATGATKEAVGKAVEAMLSANKRKEAIALMKEVKADPLSVSGIPESAYEAFLEGAEAILLGT